MKSYITKIMNGALYGLGFSIVLLASVYLYSKSIKNDSASDYPPELKEEYFNRIEIIPSRFYFIYGRIRISGVVQNNTGTDLQQVNIVAKVKASGTPLEKCTSLADGVIRDGGEMPFTIYCITSWHDVDAESLTAEFEPYNVYIDVPRHEK